MKGCLAYRTTGKCHCGLYEGNMTEEETIDFIIGLIENDYFCTCSIRNIASTICRELKEHPLYNKALEKMKNRS